MSSTYGSGDYGRWGTDGFGLPAYHYRASTAATASVPDQTGGASEIEHQIGNDHIVADASEDGSVELWSQDRLYQWANHYDASSKHFAGGYGYLAEGGQVASDTPSGVPRNGTLERIFGVGYYEKELDTSSLDVVQRTFAPFGNEPVLLDDVAITNHSSTTEKAAWYEYWDVNPFTQTDTMPRGIESPVWDPRQRILSAEQMPDDGDTQPLSIFAADLSGPVSGFDTSVGAFFGQGNQARPAAVTSGRLTDSIAPPAPNGRVGSALFVFRAPLIVPPGQTVTLRYAYGMAEPGSVDRIVSTYRTRPDAFSESERAWASWLPGVRVGTSTPWLGREVAWDAYMLRSGTTYEQCAGEHIISQGGYYQYVSGLQEAFRDPLQFALPMVYADPAIAGQIIVYSAREQSLDGLTPYGTGPLCARLATGATDDNDVWLLLAAAEYGLATRDMSFFDQQVPYTGGGSATLWQHLQLAFDHQESLIGPHGDYLAEGSGDWSDGSTMFLHMTESTLVTAQLSAIYPMVAELALERGDTAFARRLSAAASRDRTVLAGDWTGLGWYARGWSGNRQIGTGAIFEEPQPWAMLSSVPTPTRARTLVSNIRRFLTGTGAPAVVHGPSKIGSSQSPAANDPDVTERTTPSVGIGDNNAVYVGGTWYSLNGALVWGLASLDGTVPNAGQDAYDEYLRNTLADHANAYPNQWDGTISVDDVCQSYYSTHAGTCGTGLTNGYEGQIMHQPAWTLFDTVALTGITPTAGGYTISPHWPAAAFSVEYPRVGVTRASSSLSGYLVVDSSGALRLSVRLPTSLTPGNLAHLHVDRNGRSASFARSGRLVTLSLHTRAGQKAAWAISW